MRLFIALRLFNESHAKAGVEASVNGRSRGKLIDINITRFHPALRNVNEYLKTTGQLPELRQGEVLRSVDGRQEVESIVDCRLYWCEVETDQPVEYWCSLREVEAVIPRDEFNKFVLSIRYRSGAAYIEACEEFAQQIHINHLYAVRYEPPRHHLSPFAA